MSGHLATQERGLRLWKAEWADPFGLGSWGNEHRTAPRDAAGYRTWGSSTTVGQHLL